MTSRLIQICSFPLLIASVIASAAGSVQATGPQLSGSYQVVERRGTGANTRVRLRIELLNRDAGDLQIQGITLWDLPRANKGSGAFQPIVVHAHASARVEQDFIIQRSEFELWRRGTRPKLAVQLRRADGSKGTAIVRLDPISARKAN